MPSACGLLLCARLTALPLPKAPLFCDRPLLLQPGFVTLCHRCWLSSPPVPLPHRPPEAAAKGPGPHFWWLWAGPCCCPLGLSPPPPRPRITPFLQSLAGAGWAVWPWGQGCSSPGQSTPAWTMGFFWMEADPREVPGVKRGMACGVGGVCHFSHPSWAVGGISHSIRLNCPRLLGQRQSRAQGGRVASLYLDPIQTLTRLLPSAPVWPRPVGIWARLRIPALPLHALKLLRC